MCATNVFVLAATSMRCVRGIADAIRRVDARARIADDPLFPILHVWTSASHDELASALRSIGVQPGSSTHRDAEVEPMSCAPAA